MPLCWAGDLLAGRAFWAVSSPDSNLLTVYERRGDAWVEVTQYSAQFSYVTDLGPVAIEPSYAWILFGGGGGRGGLPPSWTLLRFDGTALHEVFDPAGWSPTARSDIRRHDAAQILR